MFRSARLERFFRRHPVAGLLTVLLMGGICVVILLTEAGARSPRSGLPMWVIATAGILLFGWVGAKYAGLVRRRRGDRP